MDLSQFCEDVRAEFGQRMEHATPANMRKFQERIHQELERFSTADQPFVIPREHATNYEQVVAEFLARVLELPPDQGVILLWIFASDFFYARLGEQYEQNLSELFTFDISE